MGSWLIVYLSTSFFIGTMIFWEMACQPPNSFFVSLPVYPNALIPHRNRSKNHTVNVFFILDYFNQQPGCWQQPGLNVKRGCWITTGIGGKVSKCAFLVKIVTLPPTLVCPCHHEWHTVQWSSGYDFCLTWRTQKVSSSILDWTILEFEIWNLFVWCRNAQPLRNSDYSFKRLYVE